MTIKECLKTNFAEIPTKEGIYWIRVPREFQVCFLDTKTAMKYFRGKEMLYPQEKLVDKYVNLKEKEILYIGKASAKKGLKQRICQYIKYGYGLGKIHRGGRAIWQIDGCENLLIEYRCCDNSEREEKRLLLEYRERNNSYPLANWRG